MTDEITIRIGDGASLRAPASATKTVQRSDGLPDVVRVFAGAVVAAVTSIEGGVPPTELAGRAVSAYQDRPGFARSSLRAVDVPGADDSLEFDMTWTAVDGTVMDSIVRLATGAASSTTLHTSCPAGLRASLDETVRSLNESLTLAVEHG